MKSFFKKLLVLILTITLLATPIYRYENSSELLFETENEDYDKITPSC